ncbi:MAG: pyrroline-5-carboxylate reductase [Gemmataceae bacterium]
MEKRSIGFLGAGKMATALAKGWIEAGLLAPEQARGSDPVPAARAAFQAATRIATSDQNRSVIDHCQLLVLAVKPQSINELLTEIKSVVTPKHLLVSIVTGFTLGQFAAALGADKRIVRVMPNTPCLVGASASAYAASTSATADDSALVDQLLNAVGRAYRVPEHLLDAVTGLSGSGPAYVYTIIEALSAGGVRVGLPRDVATVLAAQTVFGAAKMVLETGQHPGELRDMVTSPGGTTIAGLHAIERAHGLRAALMDAVEAATHRAAELGKSKDD